MREIEVVLSEFQSTLSVRRATLGLVSGISVRIFQSTLSVRRATPKELMTVRDLPISIHALREESDA